MHPTVLPVYRLRSYSRLVRFTSSDTEYRSSFTQRKAENVRKITIRRISKVYILDPAYADSDTFEEERQTSCDVWRDVSGQLSTYNVITVRRRSCNISRTI